MAVNSYAGNKYRGNPISRWTYRVGRVLDIISHPCAVTPEVWVRAFFTAIPTLLLTPICPSPTDYAIRRILGCGPSKPKFDFDVWATEEAPEVTIPGEQWAIFKGASFLSRVLWEMVVIDAMTGYFVNWTSAAFQYSGCLYPGEHYLQQIVDTPQLANGGAVNQQVMWDQEANNGIFGGGYHVITPAGMNPTMQVSISSSPSPPTYGPTSPIQGFDIWRDGGATPYLSHDCISKDGANTNDSVVIYQGAPDMNSHTWTVTVRAGPHNCYLNGTWSVFARPHRDNIQPSCAKGI